MLSLVPEKRGRKIYDYVGSKGNVMKIWARKMSMQKRERAKLDFRIDLLENVEDDLPPGLLHPTRCRHIMHLVVKGEVTLCPMVCRGPINANNEFTFLFGSIEKDRKYIPRNAPDRAEENRIDLIKHPEKRCNHERFS